MIKDSCYQGLKRTNHLMRTNLGYDHLRTYLMESQEIIKIIQSFFHTIQAVYFNGN
jgi:hypothetical protein